MMYFHTVIFTGKLDWKCNPQQLTSYVLWGRNYANHSHVTRPCASVFTHPRKGGDSRIVQVYQAIIVQLRAKWHIADWMVKGGEFRFHNCLLQRNVHSKGLWRRQEIYTESSGPKEGCFNEAKASSFTTRWVKWHQALMQTRRVS